MLGIGNSLKFAFVSLTLAALASCSSTQIKAEKDPQANLAQYKTYAWAPETQPAQGKPTSIVEETVRSALGPQLAAKGLQQVSPEEADLLVSYYATAKNNVSYGLAPGYWSAWGPAEEAYVDRVGKLTLQFVDPKTRRTVWQGSATEAIGDSGVDQKKVAEAVKEIMEKYPSV